MKAAEEARGVVRGAGRGRLTPVRAAIVLAVVVVVVGAVAYVVLNALGHTETKSSSERSCRPSTSPQCAGTTGMVSLPDPAGMTPGLART